MRNKKSSITYNLIKYPLVLITSISSTFSLLYLIDNNHNNYSIKENKENGIDNLEEKIITKIPNLNIGENKLYTDVIYKKDKKISTIYYVFPDLSPLTIITIKDYSKISLIDKNFSIFDYNSDNIADEIFFKSTDNNKSYLIDRSDNLIRYEENGQLIEEDLDTKEINYENLFRYSDLLLQDIKINRIEPMIKNKDGNNDFNQNDYNNLIEQLIYNSNKLLT